MKKILYIALIVTLIVTVAACIACDDDGEEEELLTAEIPTLKIGDEWVIQIVYGGDSYTGTAEVTGEDNVDGKECYIIETLYNPPFFGFENSVVYLNKATYESEKFKILEQCLVSHFQQYRYTHTLFLKHHFGH